MQVRYYIIDNNRDEKHEFNDIESMQAFLIIHADEKGEVFVESFSGVKITYDTYTGDVRLESRERSEWITLEFSEAAFHSQLLPVQQAVQYIAKLSLITELYLLRDQGLCGFIEKFIEIDSNTGRMLSHPGTVDVEDVLLEISNFVQPYRGGVLYFANLFNPVSRNDHTSTSLHHAVSQAFAQFKLHSSGLDEIKSRQDVARIMKTINDYYQNVMGSEERAHPSRKKNNI